MSRATRVRPSRATESVAAVKLRGAADLWRLRVGDYRVVYQVRDAILVVLVILMRHRREAHR